MKRVLCIFGLLMQYSAMQATWVVVKIDNQSDLTLVQAARTHNNVEIQSISQILTKPQNSSIVYLDADALFGSVGGCKIIAQTPQGNQIAFAFFGDLTHRVANGRAREADLDSRNAAAFIKQSMIARVFMEQGDDIMKLVGFAGYEDEKQKFALTITGSNGDYQVQLALV